MGPLDDRDSDLVLDRIPGLLAALDSAGRLRHANTALLAYTGLSTSELRNWSTNGLVHPEDVPLALIPRVAALRAGTAYEARQRLRRFDHVYRWFRTDAAPFRGTDGHIAGWYVQLTDVDELDRAEHTTPDSTHPLRATPSQVTPRTPFGTDEMLAETIPAMMWAGDASGELEYLSHRAVVFLGRSVASLSGERWLDVVHVDDREAVIRRWQGAVAATSSYEDVYRLRRFDGQYRWIRSVGALSRDVPGRARRWYGLLIDIDEQRRAEDGLRESEQHWRSIVDTIPALVCTFDASGVLEHVNRQGLEYLGQSVEQLRSWPTIGIVPDRPDDDLSLAMDHWRHSVDTGAPYEVEHRVRGADGVLRWFRVRGQPLRDASGNVVRWYVLLVDIEARKRAEEALRRSAALLAQSQRQTRTGSLWWQLSSGDIVWSDESYRLMDYPTTTVPTLELIMHRVHPEDRALVSATVDRMARDGSSMDLEHRLLMPDGAIRHVRVVVQCVGYDAGRPEFAGAITDISDRKRADDELRRARATLVRATQVATVAELSASIAHEVNQPLASVVANGQACQAWLTHDPPNVARALLTVDRIVRDGYSAAEVVARIRALFTQSPPATTLLEMSSVIEEVLRIISAELPDDSVLVHTDLQAGVPMVVADRVQIQQVLMNLVHNAIESMADVDGRRKLVSIRVHSDGAGIVVHVSDQGSGVTDPALVFDAFHTTKTSGMGMGLAISRSIVENHGGRLWLSANTGIGATFSFTLPHPV